MKKTLLLAAILLAFIQHSQNKVGIKLGPSISIINGPYRGSSKTLYHAGVDSEIKVWKFVFVQPEVLYLRYSYDEYNNFLSGPQKDTLGTVNLHFASFPLLAKLQLKDYVSAHIGPQINLLMNAKYRNTFLSHAIDTASSFKRLSLDFCAGFMIDVTDRLRLDVRYTWGLTKLNNYLMIDKLVKDYGTMKVKSKMFLLSIGYRFNLPTE